MTQSNQRHGSGGGIQTKVTMRTGQQEPSNLEHFSDNDGDNYDAMESRIRKVDDARLCGPSLPIKPTARSLWEESVIGRKNP